MGEKDAWERGEHGEVGNRGGGGKHGIGREDAPAGQVFVRSVVAE